MQTIWILLSCRESFENTLGMADENADGVNPALFASTARREMPLDMEIRIIHFDRIYVSRDFYSYGRA